MPLGLKRGAKEGQDCCLHFLVTHLPIPVVLDTDRGPGCAKMSTTLILGSPQ